MLRTRYTLANHQLFPHPSCLQHPHARTHARNTHTHTHTNGRGTQTTTCSPGATRGSESQRLFNTNSGTLWVLMTVSLPLSHCRLVKVKVQHYWHHNIVSNAQVGLDPGQARTDLFLIASKIADLQSCGEEYAI